MNKPHFSFIIDATMISTFRSCEEKYKKRMKSLLVPKTNNGAIGSGLVFHEAAAAFRKMRKEKVDLQTSFNGGLLVLRNKYKEFMPPEFTTEMAVCPDDRRTLPNLERIFEAWVRYEEKQNFKYLYIEQSGGISLGSVETDEAIYDVIYSVIIDAIVEQQGCVFVDDIKTTTANITQPLKDSYRLSQQIMGYVVAGKELIGIPIYGGLISLVWFQKESKTGKAKPVEEYFHTVPLTFTPAQFEEWHRNTLLTVRKILDCESSDNWQMDLGNSCGMYGGCTYKHICWSTPEIRDQLIKVDFDRATWTPLEEVRSRKVELDD